MKLLVILFTAILTSFKSYSQADSLLVTANIDTINLKELYREVTKKPPGLHNSRAAYLLFLHALRPVDTVFDDAFLESLTWRGCDNSELQRLVMSEIIFFGEIVQKENNSIDTCRQYKTKYSIIVEEIIFTLLPIEVGDTVHLLRLNGIVGDVCTPGGNQISLNIGHLGEPLIVGSEGVFSLSNLTYFFSLKRNQEKEPSSFDNDELTVRYFSDFHDNSLINKKNKTDVYKEFLEKIYN